MMSYYTPSSAPQQQGMFIPHAQYAQQPGMYVQQQPGRVSPPNVMYQQQPLMMQQQVGMMQQQQQPVMMQQQQPVMMQQQHHVVQQPQQQMQQPQQPAAAHPSKENEHPLMSQDPSIAGPLQPGRTSPVPAPNTQVQLNAISVLRQRINAEAAVYPADVMAYCTDGCLSRYLRARDWDVEQAYKMLKGSLDWRSTFKPHLITEAQVAGPMKIGTMFHTGFDKLNRPVIYVKPGAHSPNTLEERVTYVAWLMEHVASLMGENVEQVLIIMDFSEFGKRAKSPDSRQTAQAIINILQNHYPERLGSAIVINSPWYFNLLFKMMSPFINANTKKKMNWITGDHQQIFQILCQSVDPDQLLTIYGGKNANFPAGATQAH